jgi:hypothetical protein
LLSELDKDAEDKINFSTVVIEAAIFQIKRTSRSGGTLPPLPNSSTLITRSTSRLKAVGALV